MGRKKRTTSETEVKDYRHDSVTRKNIPPTGLAVQGTVSEVSQARVRL